ncbi:hypothetical protein [uncultured Methanobrevibacter sp.]|jgi:hypothetical protein|uniref:hypothetical protein n=1 Tax=uncultured Methanobrevibacter sp. TaxID=253161 RepID=UPI0025F351B2|nr:hypothetical protein [uncultured Methanobrevibacter sp.]
MASENKNKEYIDTLNQDKIMIETHFANIERILRETDKLEQDKAFALLSNFNTLSIRYEQLCNDLITFIKIFDVKESQEIRLYKTDELVELLESKVNELES